MSSHSLLRRTSRRSGSGSRIFSACSLEGLGVGLDLLLGEHRAQGRAPRGVAHAGGVVADDQHHAVAGVLELAQLAQHDGVAEVDVGRGGIDAELHAQGPPLAARQPELVRERALGQAVDGVTGESAGELDSVLGGCVGGVRHAAANARLSPPGGSRQCRRATHLEPSGSDPPALAQALLCSC